MLSDNSEKSRNPLKKAIRRRNAKTVQFAAPTYVEASDYDYSSEEEDAGVAEPYAGTTQPEDTQRPRESAEEERAAEQVTSQEDAAWDSTPTRASFDREQAATVAKPEDPQLSPKLVDKTEAAPLKSKRTRNTDSFLKDDNNETRKITLTPGLLREDSMSGKSVSSDSTRNGSLESLVKQTSPPESQQAPKDKKEKKEKKGGMLSGLFRSRKKSKPKDDCSDQSDADQPSGEVSRESPMVSPLASGRNSPGAEDLRRQDSQSSQHRGTPQKAIPSHSPSPQREIPQEQPQEQLQDPASAVVAELQGSEAAHEMGSTGLAPLNIDPAQQDKSKGGRLSPISSILKRDDSKSQTLAKATRAKQRVELDDFDSPDEDGSSLLKDQEDTEGDRLSESPIEITHNMHGTDSIHVPTPTPDDQPDVDDDEDEPGSLTSSPSLIEHPAEPVEEGEAQDDDSTPKGPRSPNPAIIGSNKPSPLTRDISTDSATTQSSATRLSPATTVSQQSWSDSSLRAWLEDGSEVKDMMVLIHDKSGVVPVSDDHPMMAGLFTEQRKGVQNMMGELDGLLGSYLQRKGIAFT